MADATLVTRALMARSFLDGGDQKRKRVEVSKKKDVTRIVGRYWPRSSADAAEAVVLSRALYFEVREFLQRGKYAAAIPILVKNPHLMAVSGVQSLLLFFARRHDTAAMECMLKAWPRSEYSIGSVLNNIADTDVDACVSRCGEFYASPEIVRLVLAKTDWDPAAADDVEIVSVLAEEGATPGVISILFNGVAAIFARQVLLSFRKDKRLYSSRALILAFLGYDTKLEKTCAVRSRFVAVDYVREFLDGARPTLSGEETTFQRLGTTMIGLDRRVRVAGDISYTAPRVRALLDTVQELIHCGVNWHNGWNRACGVGGPDEFSAVRMVSTLEQYPTTQRYVRCIKHLIRRAAQCPTCPEQRAGYARCASVEQCMRCVCRHIQKHEVGDSSLCFFYDPINVETYQGFVRGTCAADFFRALRAKVPHWACLEHLVRQAAPLNYGFTKCMFEELHCSLRKNYEFDHGQHNLVILLLLLYLRKLPLHCRNDLMLSFLAEGVVPAVQLVLDFLDQEKDVGTLPAGRYTAKRVMKEHTKGWNAVRLASVHMPLPIFERVVNRYHPHFSVWLLSEALASAEQELVIKRSLAKAWASL